MTEREKFMIVFRAFTITMYVGLIICFCVLLHNITQTEKVSEIIADMFGMLIFTYAAWDMTKTCLDEPYKSFLKATRCDAGNATIESIRQ